MSQSLTNILTHVVFSTKQRRDYLHSEVRASLYPYLAETLHRHQCCPHQIGGTANHVHILCGMSKNISSSEMVEHLKTSSSRWLKTKYPTLSDFYWQRGYGAFSVSASHLENVCAYIANQAYHH